MSRARARSRREASATARLERFRAAVPLAIRDALTLATVISAMSLVIVISLSGMAHARHAAALVKTEPHVAATLVEVIPGDYRASPVYRVQLHGSVVEVDDGYLIQNPQPGKIIDVVQDPDNPSHVVVVGSPEDRGESVTGDLLMWVLMWSLTAGVGVFTAFFTGLTWVPERAEPIVMKLFDGVLALFRWLSRLFGRR